MIVADARKSQAERRLIVFLGDYIDRGPEAPGVIDILRAGPPPTAEWRGFRWICLKGNHEEALLRFLDGVEGAGPWLSNGGRATIEGYAAGESFDLQDHRALQALLLRRIPASHRAFLADLPLTHSEGGYFFVHAGVRPGIALAEQDRGDLLWIRGAFLDSSCPYGKVVVHGHSIVRTPDVRPNRIGIDTGAYYTGRLTALVAEGKSRGFLST